MPGASRTDLFRKYTEDNISLMAVCPSFERTLSDFNSTTCCKWPSGSTDAIRGVFNGVLNMN